MALSTDLIGGFVSGTEFVVVLGALSIFLSGLSVFFSLLNFTSVFGFIRIISSLPFDNNLRTFGIFIPFFFASASLIYTEKPPREILSINAYANGSIYGKSDG